MRYEFTITIGGYGSTPGEAWEDAVEGFTQDPGDTPETYTTEEGGESDGDSAETAPS